MAGSNDLSDGKPGLFLNQILAFVTFFTSLSTIVIINIPKRVKLRNQSLINSEIDKVNRKLLEIAKKFKNVRIIECDKLDRSHFTVPGDHFNCKGKSWLAHEIDKALNQTEVPSSNPLNREQKTKLPTR